ncbi:MAG: DUF3696 domain-containing protein [Candidatus Dadabacteria bacterium]|nr:DUF3696 domain-containing protein [Candidatus Dadabacteria bacterium]
MITKWNVHNFKSIRDEEELDLGRLTIFAGANSSGKSTILQSILLIAQTLSSKLSSRSVVLNGALTRLGQFNDLKSNGGESDQITIKYTCRPSCDPPAYKEELYSHTITLQEIECEISFDAGPPSSREDVFQIQPRLFSSQLVCVSKDEKNTDQRAEISICLLEGLPRQLYRLNYGVELDETSIAELDEKLDLANPVGCILRHFLPESITCKVDTIRDKTEAIIRALQGDIHPSLRYRSRRLFSVRSFDFSEKTISVLRDILQDIINFDKIFCQSQSQSASKPITFKLLNEYFQKLPSDTREKIRDKVKQSDNLYERISESMWESSHLSSDSSDFTRLLNLPLPRQINEATSYLDRFFTSSLKYLGPLRDAPRLLYPFAPTANPTDVGSSGEYTAAVLNLYKNKEINYIPSKNFKTSAVHLAPTQTTLEFAVIDWLRYLGVASTVKSQDLGKLGHKLEVGLDSVRAFHDLTHVGVGVSQVLPILVISLLADKDSTLVFEQPELHLHPKVQTLLSDFFISMALCNKQCIIETHSEYFIDRLRFRIAAESPKSEISRQSKIYFVEKSSQVSSFREVMINEYGAISDWPEGFFDQSQQQAEEILRAATAKRKSKRSN